MKTPKTSFQIKNQMEFWALKKRISLKTNTSPSGFELFDLLDSKTKKDLINNIDLSKDELIVFVIKNRPKEYIINTTKRFLKLANLDIEQILYTEFQTIGLNETATIQTQKLLKVRPEYKDCYFIKKNGDVIIWEILYESLNCFIQATKRCELIGRKYTIQQ